MKFFAVAALFAGALAMPTADVEARTNPSYNPCTGTLYGNLRCAATDVLSAVCLNAVTPSRAPRDAHDFKEICSEVGKGAYCAVLPVLGQAVLCIHPPGTE